MDCFPSQVSRDTENPGFLEPKFLEPRSRKVGETWGTPLLFSVAQSSAWHGSVSNRAPFQIDRAKGKRALSF